MNKKYMLYAAVIVVSGAAGLTAGYLTRDGSPEIAEYVPLKEQAEAGSKDAETKDVDFEMDNMDGTRSKFSDWSGKPRLVNFWATWCAPCRREIPLLKDVQDEQAVEHLQVLGIAVDEMADVISYNEQAQFNYPILVGQEDAMIAAEAFGIGFLALPFTMVMSANDELLNVHIGEIDRDQIDAMLGVLKSHGDGKISTDQARELLAAVK